MKFHFGTSYNEFGGHIRWKEIFSLWINDFPVIAIRRYDDPHANYEWKTYFFSLMGIGWNWHIDAPSYCLKCEKEGWDHYRCIHCGYKFRK